MHIHVVRHADAGSRRRWDGSDELRPLSDKGRAQATAVADQLCDAGIDLIWTSPYARCRQTVEPLAARLKIPVANQPLLVEGGVGPQVLDALLEQASAGHTVLACSHGDVIPELVRAAVLRGAELDGPPTARKAGRYDLVVAGEQVATITYHDRPELGVD